MTRVVTTAHKAGYEEYGQRWLDSRRNWPAGTEFYWYTEGYELPHQPDELDAIETCGANGGQLIERRDILAVPDFAPWRLSHAGYRSPDWRFDVVKWAHKVFAAIDALTDYEGVGVWLDADCVTYKPLPAGLIEQQVADAYIALYQRQGFYSECGMWIVNGAHPEHRAFMGAFKEAYLKDRFKGLSQWHDCMVLDALIKEFFSVGRIKVKNLSGAHAKAMHPQAASELGAYIDHMKGARKGMSKSPENKQRLAA